MDIYIYNKQLDVYTLNEDPNIKISIGIQKKIIVLTKFYIIKESKSKWIYFLFDI